MAKDQKKGINTNSNAYTIIYAMVMVIIVAFLLAFVSDALGEKQNANVENDTKGQILTALGYDKATIDVQTTFKENVKDNILKEDGSLEAYTDKFLSSYGAAIKEGKLHVFEGTTPDGKKAYVLPVTGRGLWGGLWGYIAVDETKSTILGTYFYHESETAGLGARIGDRDFQEKFIGKPVQIVEGKATIEVVKDGAAVAETQVNGVTGATLTSKGVSAMVSEGLGLYAAFLGQGAAPKAEGGCCQAEGQCPMKAAMETLCDNCKEELMACRANAQCDGCKDAMPCDSCKTKIQNCIQAKVELCSKEHADAPHTAPACAGQCPKAEGSCCQAKAEGACPKAEGKCCKDGKCSTK